MTIKKKILLSKSVQKKFVQTCPNDYVQICPKNFCPDSVRQKFVPDRLGQPVFIIKILSESMQFFYVKKMSGTVRARTDLDRTNLDRIKILPLRTVFQFLLLDDLIEVIFNPFLLQESSWTISEQLNMEELGAHVMSQDPGGWQSGSLLN